MSIDKTERRWKIAVETVKALLYDVTRQKFHSWYLAQVLMDEVDGTEYRGTPANDLGHVMYSKAIETKSLEIAAFDDDQARELAARLLCAECSYFKNACRCGTPEEIAKWL